MQLLLLVNKGFYLTLSEGPIGLVTFTGLSVSSINIEVDNGTEMGNYNKFVIVRVNKTEPDVCEIWAADRLNDCTDTSANYMENNYIIHAVRPGGVYASGLMKAYTLSQDRALLQS